MTESIEPFFFGEPSSQLFGCHHAPRGGESRYGVILCYPIGHEYVRTHRAFRLLADRLAGAGFHVLRFDYFGTGDSSGEYDEASPRRWVEDCATAVEELRGRCDVTKLFMVGLRMGATLAMMMGAERGGVAGLVLWDPVVHGAEYLEELIAMQREAVPSSTGRRSDDAKDGEIPQELVGFPMSESMLEEIQRIDVLRMTRPPAPSALLIDSAEEPQQRKLRGHLESLGLDLHYEHVPSPQPWTRNPYKMLLPHTIMERIVAWATAQKR